MSSPPQSYKNGLVQYGQGSHEVPKAPENPENPQPNFRRQTSTRSASTSYSSRYNRSDSRDPSPQNGFENKSVECITIDGISAVEIRSTHLLGAIKKVSQRSQLQPILDSFTEQEPYPVLFDCLDDVEKEVTQMNSEDAADDLKLLHSFIDYVYPIWNEAREEKSPNELVKYGMILMKKKYTEKIFKSFSQKEAENGGILLLRRRPAMIMTGLHMHICAQPAKSFEYVALVII